MAHSATRWDLVVIGAGIVGGAAAYYAAKAGLRVLVVERDTPGSAQSGRNLGFVRQQARDFAELDLMIGARRLWEGIEAELGRSVGWRQGGNVSLALSEADLASRREWQRRGREAFGLDTRMLSADETFALLPYLARDRGVIGAMHTPSDGRAEPARATRAFHEAALELGVTASLGEPASGIDVSAGQVSGVWVGNRFHRAGVVLCAAGAGSAPLLRDAGLDLPQERIRATVVRTARRPEVRLDACVSGPLTGIRQDANGAFVLSVAGGEYDLRPDSWRHMRHYAPTRAANPDAARVDYLAPLRRLLPGGDAAPLADIPPTRDRVRPEPRRAREALAEFGQLFPALADLPAETTWAGVIDTLPDLVPALGPVEGVDGLLVATGFSGHGFGPGPMAGMAMAELAVGRPSPVDLAGLSPMRFRKPRPGAEGARRA